jgi:hypothetical protein
VNVGDARVKRNLCPVSWVLNESVELYEYKYIRLGYRRGEEGERKGESGFYGI